MPYTPNGTYYDEDISSSSTPNTEDQSWEQVKWMMSFYGLDPNNPDDVEAFGRQWNGATTIPGSTQPNTEEGRKTYDENIRQNERSRPVSQSQNWGLGDDYITSRDNVNAPVIDNVWGETHKANESNNSYVQPVVTSANKVGTAADQLNAMVPAWQRQSAQSAASANAADQEVLRTYTDSVNNTVDFSRGNYENFANKTNAQPILTAGGYGPDVVSQAQYARANPQDIANQNAAYSQLGGFASGQYDYTSQAAGAYADPAADAMYREGIAELGNIAGGSKDVKPGDLDPEAYAAAVDARDKFKALTTPQITAAERLIYERGRLEQEQGERALRGAAMSNLRERGMGGGASEQLAAQLGARQLSQNRLLGDLGAQANAVNRSMAALQGYAGVSTQMNAQANALSTANRDRQLAAQGMYVDQSGQLRRDTFQESYARGVAADRATEFNTTTKLNATNMQGQLATDMRTQSFNEDFSTKSAADQMATFNKAQSQISQRWQEGYAADQQRDLTNRNHLVEQAGNQYTDTAMTGATNIANGGFGVNSAADARTQGSIGVQSGLGMNAISGYSSASGAQLGAGQFGVNVNQGNLNNIGSAAGLRITDNNTTTDRHVQSYQDKTKANAADVGMQIAAASIPPIKNEDDGSDNDFDRWQNSNRGAHDFD